MSVEDWRRKIDEIDRKLVELLNERSQCVVEIGRLKRQDGSPLYQPDREREVLAGVERANRGLGQVDRVLPGMSCCHSASVDRCRAA